MKLRWLLLLILAAAAVAQTTPNLGLQLPAYNTQNWNIPLNTNFLTLDSFLSGQLGYTLPNLNLTTLTLNGVLLNGVTGTGNIVGSVSPTITSPTINGSIDPNGSGFKHQRFTGAPICTINTGGAFGTADCGPFNWAAPFVDANYHMQCTPIGPFTGVPTISGFLGTPTATGFTVHAVQLTNVSTSFTALDCVAEHNP